MCQTQGWQWEDRQVNQWSRCSVGYARNTDAAHTMASASEGEKNGFLEETLELKSEEQSKFSLVVVFNCYMHSTGVNIIKHLLKKSCVHSCGYMHVSAAAMEARRRWLVPWNWSWHGGGSWTWAPGKSSTHSSLPRCSPAQTWSSYIAFAFLGFHGARKFWEWGPQNKKTTCFCFGVV